MFQWSCRRRVLVGRKERKLFRRTEDVKVRIAGLWRWYKFRLTRIGIGRITVGHIISPAQSFSLVDVPVSTCSDSKSSSRFLLDNDSLLGVRVAETRSIPARQNANVGARAWQNFVFCPMDVYKSGWRRKKATLTTKDSTTNSSSSRLSRGLPRSKPS